MMNPGEPRALSCPSCGGPITFQSPFCAYCRKPLHWGAAIDIERGEPLLMANLTRDPLPSAPATTVRRADGLLFEKEPDKFQWGLLPVKLRDACVVMRATCLDASGGFGILARVHNEGQTRSGYELDVYSAFRAWRLRRLFWGDGTYAEVLRDWEVCSPIRGYGVINEIELRYADSVFQVLANGERLASIIDATFGFGSIAWQVNAEARTKAQIVVHAMEVYRARA